MLHLDGNNCPKFNASLTQAWPAYEVNTKAKFGDFLTRLGQLYGTGSQMGVMDGLNACEYLLWAYYHDVELTFSYVQSDIDSCNALTISYYNYYLDVDESLGYLAANQYLKKLLDSLNTVTGHVLFHETPFFKTYLRTKHESLSLEEAVSLGLGDSSPRFYFYVTEQVYMRMLLSGLMGKDNRAQYPQIFQTVPKPSLQFAFEVIVNTDGTKTVAAHLSDVDIVLGGCTNTKGCDINAFKQYLNKVANMDVPTVCNPKSHTVKQ
jgi:hypothetical protein